MMNDQQRARSVDAIRRAHAVMGSQTKLSFATGIAASRLSALINDQAVASAMEAATIEKATGKKVRRHEIRPDMFNGEPFLGHWSPGESVARKIVAAEIAELLLKRPAKRAPAPNPQPPAAKVTDGKARSRQEPQAEGRKGKAKEHKGTGRSRGDR